MSFTHHRVRLDPRKETFLRTYLDLNGNSTLDDGETILAMSLVRRPERKRRQGRHEHRCELQLRSEGEFFVLVLDGYVMDVTIKYIGATLAGRGLRMRVIPTLEKCSKRES